MAIQGPALQLAASLAIETPCVKVCVVDEASGLCLGCHRTLDEVAVWGRLSAVERRRIMDQLPLRAAHSARGAEGGAGEQ